MWDTGNSRRHFFNEASIHQICLYIDYTLHMPSIETVTALLLAYRYLIIIPLSLVAQPTVGMLTGALARLGYFDVVALYTVLLVTAVLGDVAWYWIGAWWGEGFVKRFGRFVSITPSHVKKVKEIFNRYHPSILLVSKITNGFGLALVTLFTAGLTRVPFWRFVGFNIIGEAMWSAMILAVGYFFSDAYIRVNNVMGRAFLVVLLAGLILALFGFVHYMRKRLEREFEDVS